MTDISKSEFLEAVSKELEDDGTLNRIRSLMRAEVLRVVSEGKVAQLDIPGSHTAAKLRETEAGKLCLSLVYDFLDHYKLKCTRSVFASELGSTEDTLKIDESMSTKLQLPQGDDKAAIYVLVTRHLNLPTSQESKPSEGGVQATNPDRARIAERTKHIVDEPNKEWDKPKAVNDFPDLAAPRSSVLSDRKQLGDVLESLKIFPSGSDTGNSEGTDDEIKEEISAGTDAGDAQSSNESDLHLSF